jgi:hypothetical protein
MYQLLPTMLAFVAAIVAVREAKNRRTVDTERADSTGEQVTITERRRMHWVACNTRCIKTNADTIDQNRLTVDKHRLRHGILDCKVNRTGAYLEPEDEVAITRVVGRNRQPVVGIDLKHRSQKPTEPEQQDRHLTIEATRIGSKSVGIIS